LNYLSEDFTIIRKIESLKLYYGISPPNPHLNIGLNSTLDHSSSNDRRGVEKAKGGPRPLETNYA
jgi:hypothetical protein